MSRRGGGSGEYCKSAPPIGDDAAITCLHDDGTDRLLTRLIKIHGSAGRPDLPECLQRRVRTSRRVREPLSVSPGAAP